MRKKKWNFIFIANVSFIICTLCFLINAIPALAQVSLNFGDVGIGINVVEGSYELVSVSGGSGDYTAFSTDNSVAVAVTSGSDVNISGLVVGSVIVTIKDNTSSETMDLIVTVVKPLSVNPSSIVVHEGKFTIVTISGGTGPYSATSSDASVAEAWVSASDPDKLAVTGSTAGTAIITITDSSYPALTTTVSITVIDLSTTPASVMVVQGGTSTVQISGGTGPYSVSSSNSSVATATVNGATITVNGVAAGSATITVSDSSSPSKSGNIDVTVLDQLLVSPDENEVISFDSSQGKIEFKFNTVSGAQGYLLNLNLKKILTQTDTPMELVLTGATSGFSVDSATGTATLSMTLDTDTWDSMSQYDITWSISALSDEKDTSSVMVTSMSRNLKIEATNAVSLKEPGYNTTFDNSVDPAPAFTWDNYSGASAYDLYLVPISGTAFGTPTIVSDIPPTYTNHQLLETLWQAMPSGIWYWTVIAKDDQGNTITQDLNIYSFDLK